MILHKDFQKIKQIYAKASGKPVESLDCIHEWLFSETDLKFRQMPNPKILANEILNNDDPMPQLVREFLADLVLKYVKPDIVDPNSKELSSHQKARIRRHEALVEHFLIKAAEMVNAATRREGMRVR